MRSRRVICVPDADPPGRDAFRGRRSQDGKRVPGILDLLTDIAARVRLVEPEATLPEGWDLAHGEAEGWDTAQALAWVRRRLGASDAV